MARKVAGRRWKVGRGSSSSASWLYIVKMEIPGELSMEKFEM